MLMIYTYEATFRHEVNGTSPGNVASKFSYSMLADTRCNRRELLDQHLSTIRDAHLIKAVLVHARTLTLHEREIISKQHSLRSPAGQQLSDLHIDPMRPSHGPSRVVPTQLAA